MNKNRLIIAFFSAVMPQLAYGYLDAGSGSYVLQIALALIFGAVFAFKSYLYKIITSIARVFGKKNPNDGPSGTN